MTNPEIVLIPLFKGISGGMWIRVVLEELGIAKDICINLYCDMKSALGTGYNLVQHYRTKHIEINRHLIRQNLDCELTCY